MYNGIGLQTPRGSGTNGYIQTNKFFIKSRTGKMTETKGFDAGQGTAGVSRKPNKDILEHDRKRQIELKLVVLEDKLIDQGYTEAEISEKLVEARKTLESAAASEETGGPTAIVVADKKVSDTQTHQIAARKERQMETLRAALGISGSELNEQNIEGSDDGPRSRKNGSSDDKREHAFLDRDFRPKKNIEEDQKVEKDNKKKGLKESRPHKEESKKRRRGTDSSDTDSGVEHKKALQRKHRRGSSGSDHDDVDKKHKSSKKHKKSRRHDSDDSDSATDSDENVNMRKISKKHKKSVARHSDDSESATDSDTSVDKKRKTSKKHKKSRMHDSDVSDSATDDDDFSNESSKKSAKGKQHMRTNRRHDSEDESDYGGVEKKDVQPEKQRNQHGGSRKTDRGNSDVEDHRKSNNSRHGKSSGRYGVDGEYDSDKARKHKREMTDRSRRRGRNDSDDDDIVTGTDDKIEKRGIRRHDSEDESGYGGVEKKEVQPERQRNQRGGSRRTERGDSDVEDHRKSSNSSHGKSSRRYDVDAEYDSDKARKHKREMADRSRRSGRNDSDSDDDDIVTGTNDKIEKRISRRHDTDDEDSDTSYERKKFKMIAGGKKVVERKSDSPIDDIDNRLYKSRREDIVGGSSYGSQEMMKSKRKFNDGDHEEKPESKLRSHNFVNEAKHNGGERKDTKAYQNKDEKEEEEDYPRLRSGGRRDNETVERGGRISGKGDEPPRLSRRDDRDYEDLGGGRRHSRDEEERRGRKHIRDEEDHEYRRHGRDDEERGSRRQVIGEEEEQGNRGYERDYSKRARYDDSRSNERKRYENNRRDDDRAQRRD